MQIKALIQKEKDFEGGVQHYLRWITFLEWVMVSRAGNFLGGRRGGDLAFFHRELLSCYKTEILTYLGDQIV